MTATQVFMRFLKENNWYNSIFPCVLEAAKIRIKCDSKKLSEFHGISNKKLLIVDELLKSYNYSLYHFPCIIAWYNYDVEYNVFKKAWCIFLRDNMKGNYLKNMIQDKSPEFHYYESRKRDRHGNIKNVKHRRRNGYYAIDFTMK